MKKYIVYLSVIVGSVVLWSCSTTEEHVLTGTASQASFTYTASSVPDTLPYSTTVTFTNKSQEAFAFKWSFGDNSSVETIENPVHVYSKSGSYNISLVSVGSAGYSTVSQTVVVSDACDFDVFNKMTGCGTKQWTWSGDADALSILSPSGGLVSSQGADACQIDDKFSLGSDGSFGYNAGGATFDGLTCQPAFTNATAYKVWVNTGGSPKLILGTVSGTGNPFIGTVDEVTGNTYEVVDYSDTTLTLKGQLADNNYVQIKLKEYSVLDPIRLLLTGGTSRKWRLDSSAVPGPITVGPSDASPSEWYSGGALADCQKDDAYTFTQSGQLIYDSNGETYDATAGYQCVTGLDYNIDYVLKNIPSGQAGIAYISLPSNFIGVTDRASENIYRIIELDDNHMILRSGWSTGVLHTMKFVRAD